MRGSIKANVALSVKICYVNHCDPFFEKMMSVVCVWL